MAKDMHPSEAKARRKIAALSDAMLVDMWEKLHERELREGPDATEARLVCSWVTDELFARHEEACIAWSYADGLPSPRAYVLGGAR